LSTHAVAIGTAELLRRMADEGPLVVAVDDLQWLDGSSAEVLAFVIRRLPASRLREVNRIIEDTAWGPYRTEFYPTYDYKAIGIAAHDKAQ